MIVNDCPSWSLCISLMSYQQCNNQAPQDDPSALESFVLDDLHLIARAASSVPSPQPAPASCKQRSNLCSHHCYYDNTDPYSYFHDITLKSHNVLSCSIYKTVLWNIINIYIYMLVVYISHQRAHQWRPCLLCLAFFSNQLLKPMSFGLAMWSWWPRINVNTPNVMSPKKLATESLASQNVCMS